MARLVRGLAVCTAPLLRLARLYRLRYRLLLLSLLAVIAEGFLFGEFAGPE